MPAVDLKQQIEQSLAAFADQPLAEAARGLFATLGYRSDRRVQLRPATAAGFLAAFDPQGSLDRERALVSDWAAVEFLFQLTDAEVQAAGGQLSLFESAGVFDGAIMESYVFLAIELRSPQQRTGERAGRTYTRTELAQITRAVNRLFTMPAMVLFRHGDSLSLGVVKRRLHKRDPSKDVQEKVTLIKDITAADPLRAHLDILHDVAMPVLHDEYYFHNFAGLHLAWEKRLGSYALNERFYREVADWYFWALARPDVILPRSIQAVQDSAEREKQRSVFFIRLLTRLIFCWFLQEKRLIPRDLFRKRVADGLLKDASMKAGTYYRAFLQNLFFGTLNQEQDKRDWRKDNPNSSRKGNRGATNLWRYSDHLAQPSTLEALLRGRIPFVNGGLFDCLDVVWTAEEKTERLKQGLPPDDIRIDDFSEENGNGLCLPNELFFGDERDVDLSDVLDDKRRRHEKVRGLIEILSRYKFTVEENTPLEEEIALDPELLGKVFENLLASYNEDTRTTARKALGAFYTPREIVDYMVDESLMAYLVAQVPGLPDGLLDVLFGHEAAVPVVAAVAREQLIAAIGRVKILDPACGSGAFPMGALRRLVDLLQKLDPNNESWKRDRLAEAERYYEVLRRTDAAREELEQCEARIEDIRHSFDTRFHALDFARKLYLIEDCLYGVDIQPIACQIAKLRVFIALIVDQNVDPAADNLGVRPLPNLETKFVAADTLIPIEKPDRQMDLLEAVVRPLRRQLEQVRHDHFNARTPARKARCRAEDARLRGKIAELLRQSGLPAAAAKALAAWDPYDQNAHAPFFDSEWMFGLPVGKVRVDAASPATLRGHFAFVNEIPGQMELLPSAEVDSGFDIVIGNPPYVRLQTLKQQNPKMVEFYKQHYAAAARGNYDLYVVFVEAGLNLLRLDGQLAYILPHKFFNAQYGEPLRALLAKGRHLRHVVHFGDQQVFPGATNYVCLLFLAKAGAEECRFVSVKDAGAWYSNRGGETVGILVERITGAEWNFVAGPGADLSRRLGDMPTKLSDVADVFVGLQTSADDVFILDMGREGSGFWDVGSKALGRAVTIEADLLHPIVSGTDVGSYDPLQRRQCILFPYLVADGQARLIPLADISARYPKCAAYLNENKARLESREGGAFRDAAWHRFGRSQNLAIQNCPKVCVPRLVEKLHAAFDLPGGFFLDNVDVCGVVWSGSCNGWQLQFLGALLNSAVCRWFFPHISAPFRGGWRSANRQFISLLPIPQADAQQRETVVRLVDYLLWLNRHFQEHPDAKTARDPLMLGYFEQGINGLVYELYFPEELHARKLFIFKVVEEASLPDLDNIPEPQRLDRLRETFERTYDTNSSVRGALFSLGSLETVRIIEGQE